MRISWRYDPVFVMGRYSVDYHMEQFGQVRSVTAKEQEKMIAAFSEIAKEKELQIHL